MDALNKLIDANALLKRIGDLVSWCRDIRKTGLEQAMCIIQEMPAIIPQDEPLTIEQLRQMDGLPVWIVDIGNRKWYGPSWAIVDREYCLVRTVKNWNPVFFERYGKQWIAYCRPPERQEDNDETD